MANACSGSCEQRGPACRSENTDKTLSPPLSVPGTALQCGQSRRSCCTSGFQSLPGTRGRSGLSCDSESMTALNVAGGDSCSRGRCGPPLHTCSTAAVLPAVRAGSCWPCGRPAGKKAGGIFYVNVTGAVLTHVARFAAAETKAFIDRP
ncbi:hypothetical protein TcCL_NonESM09366 [Trypanosoma cruzi]|nr:hypothetical protein TcCL_NonESM09366 [Trypanosoma cruzi]